MSSLALSSFSSSILFPSFPFDTSAYIRQWVEWSFSHRCYVFIILQWCHGCFRTASWRYYCPVIFPILLSPFLRHYTRHIPFNNKNLPFSQRADHSARCFIDRIALSSAYMEDLMTTGPSTRYLLAVPVAIVATWQMDCPPGEQRASLDNWTWSFQHCLEGSPLALLLVWVRHFNILILPFSYGKTPVRPIFTTFPTRVTSSLPFLSPSLKSPLDNFTVTITFLLEPEERMLHIFSWSLSSPPSPSFSCHWLFYPLSNLLPVSIIALCLSLLRSEASFVCLFLSPGSVWHKIALFFPCSVILIFLFPGHVGFSV